MTGIVCIFTENEKQISLRGRTFSKMSLDRVDFSKADLRGARFEQMSLTGCDFSGANLREAHFVDCNLTDACFDDALLQGCHFEIDGAIGFDLNSPISRSRLAPLPTAGKREPGPDKVET